MNYPVGHFFSAGFRRICRAPNRNYLGLLFLILSYSFPGTNLWAQDLDNLLKTANAHFEKEQYHSAAQYYQVAVGLQKDNPEYFYKLAQSYRAIFNYSQAAQYYQKTIELDETTYPLSWFYLAQMQKSMGNFKKARDGFDHFIQTHKTGSSIPGIDSDSFIKQAEIEMGGCLWAIEQLGKSWREIGFNILPEPINSGSNDYAAVSDGTGTVITITSGRRGARGGLVDNRFGEYFTDNFRYKKEDDQWTEQSTSDRFDRTNTKFSDGVGTYNAAGDRYYFTSCYEGNAYCKLYVTYKQNGSWKNPRLLNDHVNAPGYDNKHPALTRTGDTLIFVSNRPGGPGGNDLWFSVTAGDEAWGEAKLLPGNVNTPFNEASPYRNQDNLLFFSSDGHTGMGGMDIFMVEGYQQGNGKIQNLGTPFNSGFDDSFFSLGTDKGYLSSNRPNGFGKFDIYSFNLSTNQNDLADFLEESAEGTHLRSRIRDTGGSNLHSARDEDQFYYDNLTAEERARLERILAMKAKSEQDFDAKQLSKSDYKYYNKLDIDTKATIERLAQRRSLELTGLTPENEMTPQERLDWEFYQNVEEEERAIIDRIINTRVQSRRTALSGLKTEELLYTVNSSNQERIGIKVQIKTLDSLSNFQEEQHKSGMAKLDQNTRDLAAISEINGAKVSPEAAQKRSGAYSKVIEGLGYEHQLYYQELSPEIRDNLHRSALREYLIDNNQLTAEEVNTILAESNLAEDPLSSSAASFHSSYAFQMSGEIKQALIRSLAVHRAANQDLSLEAYFLQELDVQRFMLREQLELLSAKKSDSENLSQQLQEILSEQGVAADPVLEQKIVEQFYARSQDLLPLLTPKDSYYFNTLSPGQQLRLDRLATLVDSQIRELEKINGKTGHNLAAQQPADLWFYQELNQQERETVNELIARGWNPDIPYSGVEEEFIAGLSPLERDRINRMMGNTANLNFEEPTGRRNIPTTLQASDSQTPAEDDPDQGPDTTRNFETAKNDWQQVSYPGTRIYFDFDRYTLRTEAKKELSELVNFISQQNQPLKVLIEGHTDYIGKRSYNQVLGMRRGLSAAKFIQPAADLIEVTTTSYGETLPTANNNSPMGRQFNRRVELKIEGLPYQPPLLTYLVKPAVTLAMIVQATGIAGHQIMAWNGLTGKNLKSYQPLRLPVDLNYQTIRHLLFYPHRYEAIAENAEYHTVATGENLYRLAMQYNTSVERLEDLNSISARELRSGQRLRVR